MKYRLIKIKNEWLMKGEKMKAIAIYALKLQVNVVFPTPPLLLNIAIAFIFSQKCIMTKRDLQFMT